MHSGNGKRRASKITILEKIVLMADLQEYKKALKLYREGKKLTEIVQITNMSMGKVLHSIYSREKIIREIEPTPRFTPEQIARIVHLYRWGYTPNEISEEIGGKPSHIATIIEINDAERIPNINNLNFMERGNEPSANRESDRFK
jgi:hypothetical protein